MTAALKDDGDNAYELPHSKKFTILRHGRFAPVALLPPRLYDMARSLFTNHMKKCQFPSLCMNLDETDKHCETKNRSIWDKDLKQREYNLSGSVYS